MSLTDFVIATESQAKAGLEDPLIAPDDRVDLKGLSTIEVSQLHCLMLNQDWEADWNQREYPIIFEGSEDGPWVTAIPADLVSRLAALNAAEQTALADRWCQIEEFQPQSWGSWSHETIHECLRDLARMARHASDSGRNLYMWNCL